MFNIPRYYVQSREDTYVFYLNLKTDKDHFSTNSFIHSLIHSSIHSIGLFRMRQFLAVLRSFFHSSLLCTLSCHPSPPTILPSPLTSFCHLFLGLPLSLVVPRFRYNTKPPPTLVKQSTSDKHGTVLRICSHCV